MSDADLARGLPVPGAALWERREAGRRGPRPGLTVDQIVASAIALADAEGLPAASMARVAEALGVTTMALYRYVASKDELLARMYDAALADDPGEVRVLPQASPDAPAWRAGLTQWCDHQLALVTRHPWLMQAIAPNPPFGPQHVAILDAGLAVLAGTPLSVEQRVEVMGAASLMMLSEGMVLSAVLAAGAVLGARGGESGGQDGRPGGSGPGGSGPGGEAPAPEHPALLDYDTLLRRVTTPEDHPHIAEALAAGAFADDGDDTGAAFRIDLFLDGVAALIDRTA